MNLAHIHHEFKLFGRSSHLGMQKYSIFMSCNRGVIVTKSTICRITAVPDQQRAQCALTGAENGRFIKENAVENQ